MLQYFDFMQFCCILLAFAFVKLGTKFLCLLSANFAFHYFWSFQSMAMAKGEILNIGVTYFYLMLSQLRTNESPLTNKDLSPSK
jgi:hypothetical protein